MSSDWSLPFLEPSPERPEGKAKRALIILNQPFSYLLLLRLWNASSWHCCADGGANRLHDILRQHALLDNLVPDLIKGDLDSLRPDVQARYASLKVPIVKDNDQDSTDLMKCIEALSELEASQGSDQYEIIFLGGLTGRLDQTIHTLSYMHKLRKKRKRVFAVTDENVGWVLDQGEHRIHVNHKVLGPTCGLLPVGINSTILTTTGLRWNLTNCESSFDGLVSTSNHLIPGEEVVYVKTSKPIWWAAELRPILGDDGDDTE